jgi:hypothetical protein
MDTEVAPEVIAAVVASAVGWRAGARRTRAVVAAAYPADPREVARMAKALPAAALHM